MMTIAIDFYGLDPTNKYPRRREFLSAAEFRSLASHIEDFFFFIPFVLQSRYQWFCEAFLNLLCFSIYVCYARCRCPGWFMELAFASQENPCRWLLRCVPVFTVLQHLRCPVGRHGVCARVRLSAGHVDRQSNSSTQLTVGL